MKELKITNANLFQIDWAAKDRQKFLKSIPAGRRVFKDKEIAPGIMCKGVLMKDVSGGDRRSVKAMLRGKGDFRPVWWNVFNAVASVAMKNSDLERRMYAFHRAHQFLTLGRLEFAKNVWEMFRMIKGKVVVGHSNT